MSVTTHPFDALSEPSERQYPVVGEARLDPVPRRLLRRRRRVATELPDRPPGSVLLFESNGHYALPPGGPGMLSSETVVHAMKAVIVSIKQEMVPAQVPLPSVADSRCTVLIDVTFHCRVLDPVTVLDAGCWDIRPYLQDYLLADDTLRILGARDDVMTNPEVSKRILTRLCARKELESPDLPGMSATLTGIRVSLRAESARFGGTPDDYGGDDHYGDGISQHNMPEDGDPGGLSAFGPVGDDFDGPLPGDGFR